MRCYAIRNQESNESIERRNEFNQIDSLCINQHVGYWLNQLLQPLDQWLQFFIQLKVQR